MIEALISSSVLIILIIILRRILRKKVLNRVIYALWLIVAIRLMIPFGLPESPLSMMNLKKFADNKITYTIPEKIRSPDIVTNHSENSSETKNHTVDDINVSYIPISHETNVYSMFFIFHIVGTCIILIWFASVNTAFYLKLKRNRRKFKIKYAIPVYIADDLNSPCIFGILRPSIYLSKSASLQKNNLDYILSHELCHYRHGDLIWSLLRCILVSMWWFNPLVWIGAYFSKQDCEFACDESVMKNFSREQRIEYGRTLISLVNTEHSKFLSNISTSMTSNGKRLKERILLITEKSEKSVSVHVFTAIVTCIVLVCTFTSAQTVYGTNITNKRFLYESTNTHEREPPEVDVYSPKADVDMAMEIYSNAWIVCHAFLNGSFFPVNDYKYKSPDANILYSQVSEYYNGISTIAGIKECLSNYFSKNALSQFEQTIDQNYIEYNGKLFQHTIDKNSNFTDYYEVEYIFMESDEFFFQAVHYDVYTKETINYIRKFSLIYENEKWKINLFEPL